MKQHGSRFLELVSKTKAHIKEMTPKVLKQKLDAHEPLVIIDVREDHEWPTGHIPSAIHLCKGIIERDIEKKVPAEDTPILVYCSGGFRCALVADSLQQMGYSKVYSLETGLQGWVEAGYPLET